jgi:hypothetical protein
MKLPEQINHIMQAYFSGQATPEQIDALEAWLREDASHVRWFVDLGLLDGLMLSVQKDEDAAAVLAMLAESEEKAEPDFSLLHNPSFEPQAVKAKEHSLNFRETWSLVGYALGQGLRTKVGMIGSIAAVLVLGVVLYAAIFGTGTTPDSPDIADQAPNTPAVEESSPVATLTGEHNATWSEGALATGSQLRAGDRLTLTAGFAEITTNDGAVAIVEAPATIELLDNDNALRLHSGKLVGICETDASKGFVVRTPYIDITDLGTRFGVDATSVEKTEVHVFEGEVRVSLLDQQQQVITARVVKQFEAVSARSDSNVLIALPNAEPDLYEATRRIDLTVWSTGEQIREADGVDPNWKITAIDGKALDTPIAAVKLDPPQSNRRAFRPNADGQNTWITDDPLAGIANKDRYTYVTEFVIDETIDLKSLRLEIGFLADNYVSAIRLNGRSIDTPEPESYVRFSDLTKTQATEGFVQGINRLEIDVSNLEPNEQVQPALGDGEVNPQSLMVELALTGLRSWETTGKPISPKP